MKSLAAVILLGLFKQARSQSILGGTRLQEFSANATATAAATGEALDKPNEVVFSNSADIGLTAKIVRFLRDTEIGQANTSKRVFDARPLVAFAERAGLHNASVEEIYRQFVESKINEVEQQTGEINPLLNPAELVRAKAEAEARLRQEKRDKDFRKFSGWLRGAAPLLMAAGVTAATVAGAPPLSSYWTDPSPESISCAVTLMVVAALIAILVGKIIMLRCRHVSTVLKEPLLAKEPLISNSGS